MPSEGRNPCARCRRPAAACFCAHLPSLRPEARVIFLQHPRERRVAISTCRMAHLSLVGSELHHGTVFADHARLEALVSPPDADAWLLFPTDDAGDPAALPRGTVRTLIVVDGTWSQARKLVARSPQLARLPRLGLLPSQPSNYRIRREPAPNFVSTVEAVVEVLGLLERDRDRYRPILAAFDHMVNVQIACEEARVGPSRARRTRKRPERVPSVAPEVAALRARFGQLVAVYAEANAQPLARATDGAAPPATELPELLQIVAERPASGERFEAVLRPRRPLSTSTPSQLQLPAERFADGEDRAEALCRFAAFLRPDDLLCGWGHFSRALLKSEGVMEGVEYVDVRGAATRALGRRPGGLEAAATALAATVEGPWTAGRAGLRIALLGALLREIAIGRE